MSTAKHTPGPWVIEPVCGAFDVYAEGNDDAEPIASEISGPNARLIAAAPELLALLIESQDNIGGDWRARRDAAIARATT